MIELNKEYASFVKGLCSDEIKRYEEAKKLLSQTSQIEMCFKLEQSTQYINFLRLLRDINLQNAFGTSLLS